MDRSYVQNQIVMDFLILLEHFEHLRYLCLLLVLFKYLILACQVPTCSLPH